ncbi:anti-sigma factor [Enterobacteriaceae bacterium H20N1]|uniref:Anti-sigma factor n=1 Tax=Dryocola boscaweniae TaxID=2925397 RepID=A0A9X3AC79_9ENTR|nr:anti-sigma factor [Dryocola boscaweniae]MCT4701613.1 anti-sigma factor [Dryocola boscaweniae]MCT4718782.1 anti-sigma factor [Dryocola boscaweniae]
MSLPKGTDELLVAWLDNELSPAEQAEVELRLTREGDLIERLAFIERSGMPFKKAFEPLLDAAPLDDLKKHLQAPASPEVSRRSLIAAAVSFLALGMISDRVVVHFSEPEENWRSLVAQYMALYTPETLSENPTMQALETQVKTTGDRLGLSLAIERLTLPNATLKNVRVLAYDEQRIAQITWLDAHHGPLALCITANSDAPASAKSEQKLGMNIVYWANKSHRFMVIGHGSAGEISKVAGQLRQKLSV